MNRFQKSNGIFTYFKKIRFSLCLTLVIIFLCLMGIDSIGQATTEEQLRSLENSIKRNVIQCYALEGTYPPNLQYLKDHYGLIYNEDDFFVDYQTYGSNIMPDYTIICLHPNH